MDREGVISWFKGFALEILERWKEAEQIRLDDVAFNERIIGIEKATSVLLELKIDEEKIIQMLQKYWNLRRSEAKEFISEEKQLLEKLSEY